MSDVDRLKQLQVQLAQAVEVRKTADVDLEDAKSRLAKCQTARDGAFAQVAHLREEINKVLDGE